MNQSRSEYTNPLISRYSSPEMSSIFSDDARYRKWRQCWIALAEGEKELGLAISDKQIAEMKAGRERINYEVMEEKEKELRHDVMAAVHAYGEQCPEARGIIHLGATSCFVTDNTELMQMHEALGLIKRRLLHVIETLALFAEQYKSLKCLGYTHFQPAQPTTLGKRACLWLQELIINYGDLQYILSEYPIRGIKGATGTQDSFLKLFDGDHEKVKSLEDFICRKLGFSMSFPVCGQTYPRLADSRIMDLLKNISLSAHKFATDFRLMQHLKMVDEPFEEKQVGSSAMAYKKNPMRCERLCSLARYVMSQVQAADHTAATQWFERSLDDSAGRRLYIPQAFLGVDAVLIIYANVLKGIRVYPEIISKLLLKELHFLATETVIMEGVKKGGDRQLLHEAVREHALSAAQEIKELGLENRLLEKLAVDTRIPFDLDELKEIADLSDFSGRAKQQVEEYLRDTVYPLIIRNKRFSRDGERKIEENSEIRV